MKIETEKNKVNILNKIRHKPILLESIFSFIEKRFYIIIDFISKDKRLKSDLKKFFDNTKQRNNLSKELNINIKKYIICRKILEKLKLNNIINLKFTSHDFRHYFSQETVNEGIDCDEIEDEIYNFITKYEIINKNYLFLAFINIFINENYEFNYNFQEYKCGLDFYYSDYDDIIDEVFHKYKKPYKGLQLKPSDLIYFMERNNNFIFIFEFFIFIFFNYFKDIPQKLLQIFNFLHITQYFKQNNIDINNIRHIEYTIICSSFIRRYYYEAKKYSIIEKILVKFITNFEYKIDLNIFFSCLTSESSLSLYNYQNRNKNHDNYYSLDEMYLNYIEKSKIIQKIKLICIIDSNKYSFTNPGITYEYINELNFTTNKYNLNEMRRFPRKEIYSIFKQYFVTLKFSENLETISFDNEFYVKRKIYGNDNLLNYLFNQYLSDDFNEEDNALNEINLKYMLIKREQFDSMYDFHKAIFVFNKMFPKLKNKNSIELDYANINKILDKEINDKNDIIILIIDFNFKIIDDINIVLKNINNICDKNKELKSVEILIMKNFQLGEYSQLNDINIDNLGNLPKLCEFIINNKSNISIGSFCYKEYLSNEFNYCYLGYDSHDNLIFCKFMNTNINKESLYDIIHYYNQEIVCLNEINEELSIYVYRSSSRISVVDNSIKKKNQKRISYLKNYLNLKKQ